jgi:Family of unknown function (DUF6308)
LSSGVKAQLASEVLISFCREEWAHYDGVPDRDPTQILPDDVSVTVAMNSFVSTAEKVRSVHRGLAGKCNSTLAAMPVNADLRDHHPDDLADVHELLDRACHVRGVLLAVATKVLWRKRRSLIPMLDSVVVSAYLDALGRSGLKARAEHASGAAAVGIFVMCLGNHHRSSTVITQPLFGRHVVAVWPWDQRSLPRAPGAGPR